MPTTTPEIAIIGAGHIGRLLAQRLVLEDGLSVLLFNRPGSSSETLIRTDVARINDEAIEKGTKAWVKLTFDMGDIKDCRIIHYVAGAPRKAGEERSALMRKNADIVSAFLPALARNNPHATFINAANPLDLLTRHIYEVIHQQGGHQQVIGMGSSLDTKRLYEIADQVLRDMASTSHHIDGAYVIGEHGPSMTPIFSHATINGKAFNTILTSEQRAYITERTRNRGAEIIRETEHSDVAGPACRLREITNVLLTGERKNIPCALHLDSGVFMGVMGHFYEGRVRPILMDISEEEQQGVDKSLAKLEEEWAEFVGR
jgi:malate dehydrogenase